MTILIVYPSSACRFLIRTLLDADGHQVSEVADRSAIDKALAGPAPDVVLLDLPLPDDNDSADGLELLSTLRRRWPSTQVIVLNELSSQAEVSLLALEAGKRGAFSVLL